MILLKRLKKYVIDSQLYVSLTGTLFAVFFMAYEDTVDFSMILLVFFTYFSGYLYTKYQRSKYFVKVMMFNGILGFLCLFLIILDYNTVILLKWLIIIVLGLLYNSFFLRMYIRKIPFAKVFYVGFVWGLVNCFLVPTKASIPIFFISFFFITALVLPFDIRDIKYDTVKTLPNSIGVRNTKYIALLFVSLSTSISCYWLDGKYSQAFLLTGIATSVLIYFSDSKKNDLYFSFGVETCSALPFLFSIIL